MSAALRAAARDDLRAVMAIERASFPTDAWSERSMRTTFDDADVVALVAVADDGDVVGYGAVLAAPGAHDADVLTIAIAEAFRGEGTGRALLRRLVAEARGRGAKRVFLEVRADNPVARGLYESEGFAAVGLRARYYQPDGVDAVVMRLDPEGAP